MPENKYGKPYVRQPDPLNLPSIQTVSPYNPTPGTAETREQRIARLNGLSNTGGIDPKINFASDLDLRIGKI